MGWPKNKLSSPESKLECSCLLVKPKSFPNFVYIPLVIRRKIKIIRFIIMLPYVINFYKRYPKSHGIDKNCDTRAKFCFEFSKKIKNKLDKTYSSFWNFKDIGTAN